MKALTDRQKILLTLIVREHTRTAQPVGSKTIVAQFGLKLSSATIRNELAAMTELGYLRQPHTSAGRIPTEEGYRYFVSNLVQQTSLPSSTRNTISHQFYQSQQGLDHWLKLAASVLANQSQSASIVTAPHSQRALFKHLELLSVHSDRILMVLVLVGGEIRQRIFSIGEALNQETLSRQAAMLNALCMNKTAPFIAGLDEQLDEGGRRILGMLVEEMNESSHLVTGQVYLDGVQKLLTEPEFAESENARSAMRLFELRPTLDDLLSRTVLKSAIGGVQVLIGGEGQWSELRDFSIILTRYGVPEQISGTLGVIGPMRMPYGHAIGTVRFVSELLSELVTNHLIEE
ncbi:MAG: heat-inducible transcriptional repressor HrcA [Anaerolineaceae bacterium]|nr:heat-inducible transcriptional repressor HrcA [Anaerolineaceae bacterium]